MDTLEEANGMTKGATKVASQDEDTFLRNMVMLDALLRYVDSGDHDQALDELPPEITKSLFTTQGRVEVSKWVRTFRQPLVLLTQFRDGHLKGAKSTDQDLREVAEASQTALDALAARLTRLVG
jgi:hypothetical protein